MSHNHSFNELFKLENQVEIVSDTKFPILAATKDGVGKILAVNIGAEAVEFDLKLPDGWIFDKYRVLSGIDGLVETNIDFSKKYRYHQKKLL